MGVGAPDVLQPSTSSSSSSTSAPFQVGMLFKFLDQWRSITSNRFVLNMVQGHHLQLRSHPPLFRNFWHFNVKVPAAHHPVIQKEVDELLAKGPIEPSSGGAGFYSSVFVVPKHTGGLRPILNLKRFNCYMHIPSFKMPTLKTVQLIQQGDYAFSIDLQDAYLHVPIVKHHRQFLHFVWHNVPYQWRVLPFGLATAPRVFTSLTKSILFLCLRKGLRIVIYLDDILVLVHSKWAGIRARLFLCSLLVRLGLHINFSKSDLCLSQSFTFLGLCWDTVHMSVSLPPDKLADIQQLALSLLHTPHVTVCKVMSFLGKANFCINGHSQLWRLCRVIQSDMLSVYHSPTHLFSCVHFSPLSLCQLDRLANLQQSSVPLQFPLPDVVIATDATPTRWAFYFQGFGLPLSISGTWSGSLSRAHIALQELQAVSVMLHRMAFCLSGRVVALHLDNSTAKAYLCNQGGTVSPFLSRLACRILSLTDKHGITLLPAYIPTHLNVEADFLSRDHLLPEWHLLPQVAQAAFCLWGLPEVDLLASSRSTHCQHYFTLETPLPLGALGLNAFSHPWKFQVSYVFPPPALVPLVLSKFLAEHVNGQLRHLILVAPCWMEVPWLPTALSMLADIPWQCPIIKDLVMDVLVGRALKGLQYLHLTLWLLSNVCYANKGSLPQSVRWWWGQLKCLRHGSTSSAGGSGLVGVLDRVYQTMPSLPLN